MAGKQLPFAATVISMAFTFASMAGQTTTAAQMEASRVPFLTPIPSRFVIPSDDPRQPSYCRRLQAPLRCPPLLVFGGAPTRLPTIDPALTSHLPHLRVTMEIEDVSSENVSDGGVQLAPVYPWRASTSSLTASVESGGPYAGDMPGAGTVIYDALVFNACESLSSFHIRHETVVWSLVGRAGAFRGEDDSTLNATGYYNFRFTVRVDARPYSGVEDFHFSGIVSVLCSSATSL